MARGVLLSNLLKKTQETYGNRVAGRANSVCMPNRKLSTGILSLDAGLGGGIRVGWITCFYGKRSGGKTSTVLRTIGINQNTCRNCFRPASNVVACPPTGDDTLERWSAIGECDCFRIGLYNPEPPTAKEMVRPDGKPVKAGSKEYHEGVLAWKERLTENSYEEFVVAFVDMENSLDEVWATKLGVDMNRLLLIRPTNAEDGIDIMHALVCTAEIDMMAIDSIAQLVPSKELEESMEKWQQGLQARLVNKGIRKLVSGGTAVSNQGRTVTQLWINQTREKIGVMFGDPTVKPGGKGQEFAIHQEVHMSGSKMETESDQYGDKDEVIVHAVKEEMKFKITKNKTASTSGWTGSYTQATRDTDMYSAGTVLQEEFVYKLAMKYIVVKESPTKYLIGDRVFTSMRDVRESISNDKDLYNLLYKALLQILTSGHAGEIRAE